MMPILISPLKYGITISFYPIITGVDVDKFVNIYLRKFNYEKIFHKERMIKFNKEEAIIKDL